MSKTKTISKDVILKAIKIEPLNKGYFVQWERNEFGPSTNPNCKVCAVGAVLRHAGMTNRQIDLFGDKLNNCGQVYASSECDKQSVRETIETMLKQKRYLHALSVKFEYNASILGAGGKRIRKVMTKFVKENFPKRIALNVEK